ncbi:hypothetical protein M1N89_01615 [Dehalococcoidia bacterium]|nr:hypothetical protein [Dehalococcoidia bacterium]MCL0047884.1 hypothetical protein [Dehalococcoidia bacterium]MCL0081907.1 hypothetical protein [Dehalococcoidia bacterium]
MNDARRHGIQMLPVEVNKSEDRSSIEDGKIRLGFKYVKGVGDVAWTPMQLLRTDGILSNREIESLLSNSRVRTAGYVICRQNRPQPGAIYSLPSKTSMV